MKARSAPLSNRLPLPHLGLFVQHLNQDKFWSSSFAAGSLGWDLALKDMGQTEVPPAGLPVSFSCWKTHLYVLHQKADGDVAEREERKTGLERGPLWFSVSSRCQTLHFCLNSEQQSSPAPRHLLGVRWGRCPGAHQTPRLFHWLPRALPNQLSVTHWLGKIIFQMEPWHPEQSHL